MKLFSIGGSPIHSKNLMPFSLSRFSIYLNSFKNENSASDNFMFNLMDSNFSSSADNFIKDSFFTPRVFSPILSKINPWTPPGFVIDYYN